MNSTPVKYLKSEEGIDSIHVEIPVNFHDIRRFCDHARIGKLNEKLKWAEGEQETWKRKGKIFIMGDPISVTYNVRYKRCSFEFGGFLDYTKYHYKLQLLQILLHFFHDRSYTVCRIDYAVDVNKRHDELLSDIRGYSPIFVGSTIYFNQDSGSKMPERLSTLALYDKSAQIKLFSTPITRIEFRLFRSELTRLGLNNMFDSREALMKTANLIYSTLEHRLKLYSLDGKFIYSIKTDAVKTLEDFVVFLHSDEPTIYRDDPFRIQFGLMLSKRVLDWLKREGILAMDVKKHVRGKKITTCKSLGLDPKTFDKAIAFFNAI